VEYLLIASGAWLIHPVMIISLKILFNSLPGVSQELSWTLTNLTYMASSYLMFHWVKGIPFEFNAGAYDNLNMWEQMDNGDQYTPAKKYLTFVPIVLYVSSCLSSGGSAAYENDMLTCQVSTEHTLLSLRCLDVHSKLLGIDDGSNPEAPRSKSPSLGVSDSSSIECVFSESTNSISRNLPNTMINALQKLLYQQNISWRSSMFLRMASQGGTRNAHRRI